MSILYRFNVSRTSSGYMDISEIELIKDDLDVTFGGTATMSSTYSGSYTADNVIDDNGSTRAVTQLGLPHWLQIELSDDIFIDSYAITNAIASDAPLDWTLDQSTDGGVTWRTIDEQLDFGGWGGTVRHVFPVLSSYSISSTITESLVADKFIVRATSVATGDLVAQTETTNGQYLLEFTASDPVYIAVSADEGDVWVADTPYTTADKIFPTDPTATPYYYRCTQDGTSGSAEPVFPDTPGDTVTDGTAIWECVERLIQPVTHGPLIPVIVT